jgi:signal peptidase II
VGSATNGVVPQWGAGRSLGAGLRQWVALVAVAGAAVAADQVTKAIVSSSLSLGEAVDVVGPLSIHHVQNSGIAFGLFPTATAGVIVLTAVAVSWMVVFFGRSGGRHPILPVALGLLLGGSISNLADRVRLGHVTDFLDLSYWPAFNLADSFIVAGVTVLIGALLLADREPRRVRTLQIPRRGS